MSQEWKTRYPLIDIQGNNGSVDGDPAAAMRYTEARLSRTAGAMMQDLSEEVVDYRPNFDNSETEPSVLPTLVPTLLLNGSNGIAVGMATSIPPHHAGSIYDALIYAIDQAKEGNDIDIEDLIKIVQAPDFPTGGIITSLTDVHKGYRTGRGKVSLRAKYEIEQHGKQTAIVVTEIPFQVNKARLVAKIDDLRKELMKEDIKEVRDESSREGLRIVIDLKKDANPDFVVKRLLKMTDLQTSVSMNMTGLHNGRPIVFNLKDAVNIFLEHVSDVITRRTQRDLEKVLKRDHILEGYLLIQHRLQEVIELLTKVKGENLIEDMMATFGLSEAQATNIADLRVRRLIPESFAKFQEEHEAALATIEFYRSVLNDTNVLLDVMASELRDKALTLKDDRLTSIQIEDSSFDDRELIKEENLIVTITQRGLIKSVPADQYSVKGRGTKGVKSSVKEDDAISHMFAVNSRDDLLFFTNTGRCHILEVYKIPTMTKAQTGKYIVNYLNLEDQEYIVSVLPKEYDNNEQDILMLTRQGILKRLELSTLSTRMRQTRVISFKEDDELIDVKLFDEQDVLILTANGQGLRINPDQEGKGIRPMGRTAVGVRGIKLKENDYVVALVTVEEGKDVLIVTDKGYGKRVMFENIPVKGRAGQGVIVMTTSDKIGRITYGTSIEDGEDIMIATLNGIMSRIKSETIRPTGRSAAGVRIIGLSGEDTVIAVSGQERMPDEEEEDVVLE